MLVKERDPGCLSDSLRTTRSPCSEFGLRRPVSSRLSRVTLTQVLSVGDLAPLSAVWEPPSRRFNGYWEAAHGRVNFGVSCVGRRGLEVTILLSKARHG